MQQYEFLEHPADLKIRAFGKDLPEVFVNCALGMMEFLYGKCNKTFTESELITVTAEDLESLLVNWLAELLYLSDANNRAYIGYKIIDFSENKITAEVKSVQIQAHDDIKAVTYHELAIGQENGLWHAIVVFDI